MRLKGIVFPSYLNQNTGPKAPKMQWKAHCGKQAQLRNLKQRCRKVLDAKDSQTRGTVNRVAEAVAQEPMPEFGKLHLIFAGLDAADQTGENFNTCMNYIMDKFDGMKEEAHA